MRILIADDEKEVAVMIKSFLERRGYNVDIAFDGRAALKLIRENSYDVFFVDYNMPELTGIELVRYIKDNNIKLKTVMITGYPEMEANFAKRIGVDEYITKPIRMENIKEIIDKSKTSNPNP